MVSSVSNSLTSWANTLFTRLDTSNKGYVSKTDLESAFSQIATKTAGSNSSDATAIADKLFAALDSNGDSQVTQDELTSGLKKLASQMDSHFNAHRMQQAGQGGMPPPPPPGGDGDGDKDDGLTKDQLTTMAADVSSTNGTLSSQLSAAATNFDKADTNGDGKVSFKEFQAYTQSTAQTSTVTSPSASSSSSTSTDGSASGSSSSQSNGLSDAELFKQLVRLLESYGASDTATSKTAGSTLSVSA